MSQEFEGPLTVTSTQGVQGGSLELGVTKAEKDHIKVHNQALETGVVRRNRATQHLYTGSTRIQAISTCPRYRVSKSRVQ